MVHLCRILCGPVTNMYTIRSTSFGLFTLNCITGNLYTIMLHFHKMKILIKKNFFSESKSPKNTINKVCYAMLLPGKLFMSAATMLFL